MPNEIEPVRVRSVSTTQERVITPYVAEESTVECPFCAEKILVKAKKCRHCGETVDVAMRKAEEALRASEKSANVYMNAGGGANNGPVQQLRPFGHGIHIFMTVITLGMWWPIWLIVYLVRNRSVYF